MKAKWDAAVCRDRSVRILTMCRMQTLDGSVIPVSVWISRPDLWRHLACHYGCLTAQTSDGSTMPVSVWTSTLRRTIQTAEAIPFPKLRWKVLDEIQAGIFDGMTYAEIEQNMPDEFAARKADKLGYRCAATCALPLECQRHHPCLLAALNPTARPSIPELGTCSSICVPLHSANVTKRRLSQLSPVSSMHYMVGCG